MFGGFFAPLAIFFKFDFSFYQLFVFSRPVVYPLTGRTGYFYELFLCHINSYSILLSYNNSIKLIINQVVYYLYPMHNVEGRRSLTMNERKESSHVDWPDATCAFRT